MKKTIAKIETVKRYMRKHPEASVGEMSHDLEIPRATLYNYLKKIKIQGVQLRAIDDMPRRKLRMQGAERMQSADPVVSFYTSLSPLPDIFKSPRQGETVDNVNHPSHYKIGGIETIDFIEAKKMNYNLGNVIKYLTRADHKGNREEDLKKARWYLDREIMSQHISK